MNNQQLPVWGQSLCNNSVTVHCWDNRDLLSDAPSLIKPPDGTLLCSVELWSFDAFRKDYDVLAEGLFVRDRCIVFASTDNGQTWHKHSRIPFATGRFLQHESGLLFIGSGIEWQGLHVARSKDMGNCWSLSGCGPRRATSMALCRGSVPFATWPTMATVCN